MARTGRTHSGRLASPVAETERIAEAVRRSISEAEARFPGLVDGMVGARVASPDHPIGQGRRLQTMERKNGH